MTAAAGLAIGGLQRLDEHLDRADMIVVPTWPVDDLDVPASLIEAMTAAHERGARLVGLCLGAFARAATGLLDGRSAVTHWRYAAAFQRQFPAVRLDVRPLYVEHDRVVTSAGSAAALDCCLHLVRSDHGARAASIVARSLVTAPHRSGGQAQYADVATYRLDDGVLSSAIELASRDIGSVDGVDDLASLARTSRRSLERLFAQRLGTTPGAWLVDQRVQAARRMLEETDLGVDRVAHEVGFGSAQSLRRAFEQFLATTPSDYRRAVRGHHR